MGIRFVPSYVIAYIFDDVELSRRRNMQRNSVFLSRVLTGLSLFALAAQLFGQGQDRGVITGLVTDNTGSAVTQAKVTVTNQATGDKIAVDTSSAGNYTTPPLIVGNYKVEVEKAGFK